SEADMEKGQMRCEVNISLKPKGQKELGTKVEIKNLNSFRVVEKAVDYEIQRQSKLLDQGEKIVQETRGWDDNKGMTYSQRIKEEAQDYRYFPEPDLPPLHVYSQTCEGGLFDLEDLKKQLPELPWEKKEKLMQEYSVPSVGANLMITDFNFLDFFERTVKVLKTSASDISKAISDAYHYLASDILGIKEKEKLGWQDIKITPQSFAELILYLNTNKITSRVAKDTLLEMIKTGQTAKEIIESQGLSQVSDNAILEQTIKEIIQNNPKAVEDFKKGKETAVQFLVGRGMAQLRGTANPQELEKLIRKELTS
ncbi:MAG: Asp-tRNA(Asn)/Glu-tRNA(Gln) amidotransferase subunit GatB, partial [Minisyncoccia bacterium]